MLVSSANQFPTLVLTAFMLLGPAATMTGNAQVLAQLASTMDQSDPWFEMVTSGRSKSGEGFVTGFKE
jgi:hypothetical protein